MSRSKVVRWGEQRGLVVHTSWPYLDTPTLVVSRSGLHRSKWFAQSRNDPCTYSILFLTAVADSDRTEGGMDATHAVRAPRPSSPSDFYVFLSLFVVGWIKPRMFFAIPENIHLSLKQWKIHLESPNCPGCISIVFHYGFKSHEYSSFWVHSIPMKRAPLFKTPKFCRGFGGFFPTSRAS
jgi:hypothetical protein